MAGVHAILLFHPLQYPPFVILNSTHLSSFAAAKDDKVQ